MIWLIGIAIVICCIVAAAAQNEEDASREQLERDEQARREQVAREEQVRLQAVNSRRPRAVAELFAEEFPQFADDMTYVRAEQLLTTWEQVMANPAFTRHLKFLDKSQFKHAAAMQQATAYAVSILGPVVSPAFQQHALSDPANTYEKIRMLLQAANTLASGK